MNRRRVLGALGVLMGSSITSNRSMSQTLPTNFEDLRSSVKLFASLSDAQKSIELAPEDIILTTGYHHPGDGGDAAYRVVNAEKKLKANGGDIIKLTNGCFALLNEAESVNYKMFGAVGNGENDDGVQIKLTHDYANRHQLPVINLKGDFYIKKTREIIIKTSVQWGMSVFHINEKYNNQSAVFRISSYKEPIKIELNENDKKEVLNRIKPGVQIIPELQKFKNSLIVIRDHNDRIGYRSGYPGQSNIKTEFFYVEEHGKIVGDIAWSFKDYSELTAYPAEEGYLVVEGGTFFISGEGGPNRGKNKGYLKNGFIVSRSRTIIKNQWVGLEPDKQDIALNPRSGFYSLSRVYDVTLENLRLIPWEKDRPGTDYDVPAGTYGLGGYIILNTTFKNITAEGSAIHWGVFGTNFNKNFIIENCRLNRIDVHFHCWNLTIKDSCIGNKGITITGGGDLRIDNTSVQTNRFINFRRDFGAKWDGDIYITNCKLQPNYGSETSILYYFPADFDYGYPTGYANSIFVDNFVFDYRGVSENQRDAWLIHTSDFSKSSSGNRLFFPKQLHFKNIFCEGRSKGVRLMKIYHPEDLYLKERVELNNFVFNTNSLFLFENIFLENINEGTKDPYHLIFEGRGEGEFNENSLFPEIKINNCKAVSVKCKEIPAAIFLESSNINRIETSVKTDFQGELTLSNCRIIPAITSKDDNSFQLSAGYKTTFINCTIHLPRGNDKKVTGEIEQIGFMDINRSIRHNHINTCLGNDLLNFLKSKNIKIEPQFIEKLKIHHETNFYYD